MELPVLEADIVPLPVADELEFPLALDVGMEVAVPEREPDDVGDDVSDDSTEERSVVREESADDPEDAGPCARTFPPVMARASVVFWRTTYEDVLT